MRLGKPKVALAAYDRALAIEPDNVSALSGRAAALLAAAALRGSRGSATHRRSADAPKALPSAPAGMLTPWTRAETLAIAGEQARAGGG